MMQTGTEKHLWIHCAAKTEPEGGGQNSIKRDTRRKNWVRLGSRAGRYFELKKNPELFSYKIQE